MNQFIKTITLFTVLTLFISANSLAAHDINIDKGEVILSFSKQDEKIKFHQEQKDGCKAEVIQITDKNKTQIKHDKKHCPSGGKIILTLNDHEDYRLYLEGGLISVHLTEKNFTHIKFIEAISNGGIIQNAMKQIKILNQYAPAKAQYRSKNQNGQIITIKLNGGVIEFKS